MTPICPNAPIAASRTDTSGLGIGVLFGLCFIPLPAQIVSMTANMQRATGFQCMFRFFMVPSLEMSDKLQFVSSVDCRARDSRHNFSFVIQLIPLASKTYDKLKFVGHDRRVFIT